MELYIFLFVSAFLLVDGIHYDRVRYKRQADGESNDCMHPPVNADMVQCCQVPKEHVWGHVRQSMHACKRQLMEERHRMRGNPHGWKGRNGFPFLSTSDPIDSVPPGSSPTPPPPFQVDEESTAEFHGSRGRMHGNFEHVRPLDGCFMECVFQREGFLINNRPYEEALLERIGTTLSTEEEWRQVAEAAVKKCLKDPGVEINPNATCTSGSEETLRCIFRVMFLNCPNWLTNNEYCASLRAFYEACPDGPPPDAFHKFRNHHRHRYNGANEEELSTEENQTEVQQ